LCFSGIGTRRSLRCSGYSKQQQHTNRKNEVQAQIHIKQTVSVDKCNKSKTEKQALVTDTRGTLKEL
jgi:hypothetical protein